MVGKFRHDDENLSSAKKLDGSNQSGYQSPTALSFNRNFFGSNNSMSSTCKECKETDSRSKNLSWVVVWGFCPARSATKFLVEIVLNAT